MHGGMETVEKLKGPAALYWHTRNENILLGKIMRIEEAKQTLSRVHREIIDKWLDA